jgi:hypothetical protein
MLLSQLLLLYLLLFKEEKYGLLNPTRGDSGSNPE